MNKENVVHVRVCVCVYVYNSIMYMYIYYTQWNIYICSHLYVEAKINLKEVRRMVITRAWKDLGKEGQREHG
jgi:hypothetical protein